MNNRKLPGVTFEFTTDWREYPTRHNWQRKIKALGLAGILKMGEFSNLQIAHDDFCGLYKNKRCDCDPTIFNAETRKTYRVTKEMMRRLQAENN